MRLHPLFLCAGLFLSGCTDDASPTRPDPPTVTKQPVREVVTDRGHYRVRYQPLAETIPLNDHFAIEVTVETLDGNPADVPIEVDADMPAHRHGINTEPTVERTATGQFVVRGLLFHMPGEWELLIDVVTDAEPERATFPLVLE